MSPLQKTAIDIPLSGIDRKFDTKLLPLGKMLTVENGELGTAGAITKRNGYTALPMGAITSPRCIMSHGDKLLLVDKDTLYQWLPSQSAWGTVGYMPPIDVRTRKIGLMNALDSVVSVDCCCCGNVLLYAWVDSNSNLYFYAVDYTTGATVKEVTKITGSFFTLCPPVVRTITNGTNIVVVVADTPALKAYVFDPTSMGGSPGYTTYTLAGEGSMGEVDNLTTIDAVAESGGAFYATYKQGTGTGNPKVLRFTADGTVTHTYTQATNVAGAAVCLTLVEHDIFLSYLNNGLFCTVLDGDDLAVVRAQTQVVAGASTGSYEYPWGVRSATDTATFVLQYTDGSTGYRKIGYVTYTSGGAAGTFTTQAYGMYVAAKPFVYNGNVLLLALYSAKGLSSSELFQNGYYLLKLGQSAPIAKAFCGTAVSEGSFPTGAAAKIPPASVATISSTEFEVGCLTMPIEKSLYASNGSVTRYLSVSGLRLKFTGKPSVVTLGENLHINAGVLSEHDGQELFENNFHVYPEKPALGQAATGGALSNGTYQVSVIYAWFDAGGQLHRSAPSEPALITLNGGGSSQRITVTVNNYQLTNRTDVRIIVYATEAGGSVFYEYTSAANSQSAYSQTINITTTIPTTTRQLYTTDGTLEFASPPALQSLVRKGNRLYGVTHDGKLWYSHELVDGEAVAFSEYLVKQLHQDGGDYYQTAVDGEALTIFGENSIQSIFGSGPTRNGSADDLSEPKTVAEGDGIIDGSPVCRTENGVWFKSRRGISLLGPSMAVDHSPGVPVEYYNNLTLTSIVSVPHKQQVRFGNSDGSTLVFDLGVGAWSTFSNHNSVSACYWNGCYCLAKSTGAVWQQSTGFLDGATGITLTIDTPWIRLAGIQGYQRAYYLHLLAGWASAHTLSVLVSYDYNPETVAETITYPATTGYTAGQVEQVRHYLGRKCEAIVLRITETGPTGESFRLSGIALEIGVKGGLNRLATTKTI